MKQKGEITELKIRYCKVGGETLNEKRQIQMMQLEPAKLELGS